LVAGPIFVHIFGVLKMFSTFKDCPHPRVFMAWQGHTDPSGKLSSYLSGYYFSSQHHINISKAEKYEVNAELSLYLVKHKYVN
jgi:hypothetical protein